MNLLTEVNDFHLVSLQVCYHKIDIILITNRNGNATSSEILNNTVVCLKAETDPPVSVSY